MNTLYYLFLTIFAVIQVIKGTTEETTTIEVTTLYSPTTVKEDTRTTEGTIAKTGTAATEDTITTEGTIAKTGTAATEDTITTEGTIAKTGTAATIDTITTEGTIATEGSAATAGTVATAGTTTTQPTTTKTTLSGVKTTPENVNKGAQLKFSCGANTCTFEFIVPELLLRHVDPDQLKQTIGLLSEQISSVKTELDLAKLNETTYSQDINDWINQVNETEANVKADITTLTRFYEEVQHEVEDISNKAQAYLQSALCFASGKFSWSCSPNNFLPTTLATFTTESTADSV